MRPCLERYPAMSELLPVMTYRLDDRRYASADESIGTLARTLPFSAVYRVVQRP